MEITHFTEDIWFSVVPHLHLRDVLQLHLTCRQIHSLTLVLTWLEANGEIVITTDAEFTTDAELKAFMTRYSNNVRNISLARPLPMASWHDPLLDPTSLVELHGSQSLRSLDLTHCFKLTDLTPLAGCLALEQLDLTGCTNIVDISPLATLPALHALTMTQCSTAMVTTAAKFVQLRALSLNQLPASTDLGALAQCYKLRKLVVCGASIRSAEFVLGCPELRHLELFNCWDLSDITALGELPALRFLIINTLDSADLRPLAKCRKLEVLRLDLCDRLNDLSPLIHCTDLRVLTLMGCDELNDIRPLASIGTIQELSLPPDIQDLSPLMTFSNLQHLYISGFSDISSLKPCQALQTLKLTFEGDVDLEPLAACRNLEKITMYDCPEITDLSPLSQCLALRDLVITKCDNLRSLASCAALQRLKVEDCDELTDIGALAACTALESLVIFNYEYSLLSDFSPLAQCTSLKDVFLTGCYGVTDVGAFAYCAELQCLNITGCANSSIASLALCTKLHSLTIGAPCWSNDDLVDLSPLASCVALRTLLIENCIGLTDISPLGGCQTLTDLKLSVCSAVIDVSGLASCSALERLNLTECYGIIDVSPLASCPSLRYLDIEGCTDFINLEILDSCGSIMIRQRIGVDDGFQPALWDVYGYRTYWDDPKYDDLLLKAEEIALRNGAVNERNWRRYGHYIPSTTIDS